MVLFCWWVLLGFVLIFWNKCYLFDVSLFNIILGLCLLFGVRVVVIECVSISLMFDIMLFILFVVLLWLGVYNNMVRLLLLNFGNCVSGLCLFDIRCFKNFVFVSVDIGLLLVNLYCL